MTEEPIENTPADPTADLPEGALRSMNPEQARKLKEMIARFPKPKGETASGSEAPADVPVAQAAEPEKQVEVPKGSDVDWSQYDIPYTHRHLYPQAMFRNTTAHGPKWVVMIDEFHSTDRDWTNYDKMVKNPATGEPEPLNLGKYLNDMLNGPEQWHLVSAMPSLGGKVGVLLRRQVPMVLPDPVPLKSEVEVEAPRDPELQKAEDAAMDFAQSIGLTPPTAGEPEEPRSLEDVALAINQPTLRTPEPFMADVPEDGVAREARAIADAVEAAPEGGTLHVDREPLVNEVVIRDEE